MQNAWRFVGDDVLRDRLKEAKGIGTPATRAEIIKGLKRQAMLMADGKHIVPTPAGLQLYELLRAAAPALVDPGTTAIWEMRLDDVVTGKADFRGVIDEICQEAERLIRTLRQNNGGITVDLGRPPEARFAKAKRSKSASANEDGCGPNRRKTKRPRDQANVAGQRVARKGRGGQELHAAESAPDPDHGQAPQARRSPPTERMIAFAQRLAKDRKAKLPPGYDKDFEVCRRFLDAHAGRS